MVLKGWDIPAFLLRVEKISVVKNAKAQLLSNWEISVVKNTITKRLLLKT